MKLKSIPQRLGYILGAQWTRDLIWAVFTILLARHSQDMLGQIMLALSYGYLVKTAADVGLNDFLLSTFARRDARPRTLIAQVTRLKAAILLVALAVTWIVTGAQSYTPELRLIVLCIAAGFGLDGVSDSFFALCQARGRQDVEMRIRVPSALIGIGYGILCVVLNAPTLLIALYKPVESLLCTVFAVVALKRNPLAGVGTAGMASLARQMKNGLFFTCMAVCAIFYNKLNVFFLKVYGGDAAVGSYSVAWETVEGLSVLVSSALLGKVIFPLLAGLWRQNHFAFRRLAGQTARSLWAAALPVVFLICVESDRFLPLIYGQNYSGAVTAQRLLTPCLVTAFLHNLAAYVMIGMGRHKLLLCCYMSGLALNIACCFFLIPQMPLEGAALALSVTKIWVAVLTVSYFQHVARPMSLAQWGMLFAAVAASLCLWTGIGLMLPREFAEIAGIAPLLALCWRWRPPSPFENKFSAV
ncbi:MAG: polysaccharide efflux protein RfbX [Candidatus Desulfovibrio kirbyi]|uniref:Polysaccharide efflux protein RfbX n=1 Tax=Candidatus Desulfovibrio kirbyi TaxID=2696086 RepID=A0A6L2R3U0_9BACT|nr:MAG: polysaccharide efflux protein RfbX [Candidatus Desulfovibrio kirbyi]